MTDATETFLVSVAHLAQFQSTYNEVGGKHVAHPLFLLES